jgi:hypothetical protein
MSHKYLRYLQLCFVQGTSVHGAIDDPELVAAFKSARSPRLEWMYEHYALPLASGGIGKVLVMLSRCGSSAVEVIPLTPEDAPGEGMACVGEVFDLAQFQRLDSCGRRLYLLDRFHAALVRCVETFGWDGGPLGQARSRIVEDDFKFSFFWKRPLTSPDRWTEVQPLIDVAGGAAIHLVFFDRNGRELRRALLCTADRQRGWQRIRSAASKGFTTAVRFLERMVVADSDQHPPADGGVTAQRHG